MSIWSVWTTPTPTSTKDLSSIGTLTFPSATSATSGQWTTFDQTDARGNSNLDAMNDLLRSRTDVRVFDVASVVSQRLRVTGPGNSSSTQYLWKPNSPAFTVDGIHESQIGCYAIHDSGVVNPYVFVS